MVGMPRMRCPVCAAAHGRPKYQGRTSVLQWRVTEAKDKADGPPLVSATCSHCHYTEHHDPNVFVK